MVFMGTTFFDRRIEDLGRHLQASFASNFPGTALSMRYAEGRPTAPVMITVDGATHAVLAVNARPSLAEFRRGPGKGAGGGLSWPDIPIDLQVSSAYLMVLPFERAGEGTFVDKARGLTMIMAAACGLPGVLACHWGMSGRMLRPADFIEAGRQAYQRHWPMHIWSRVTTTAAVLPAAGGIVARAAPASEIEPRTGAAFRSPASSAKIN